MMVDGINKDFVMNVRVYDTHSHSKTDERMFHKPVKLMKELNNKYGWKPTFKEFLSMSFDDVEKKIELDRISSLSIEEVIKMLNKEMGVVNNGRKKK